MALPRLLLRLACLTLIAAACPPTLARPLRPATPSRAVPSDRWLEIDLYWFDPADVAASSRRFWRRYAPLYRDVAGYRGVVLNVGLTVDYIMSFSGDLDQRIPLPKGDGQELGADVAGRLVGDTAARQQAWRERFAHPADGRGSVGYGAWTYRRMARLADALRVEGRRRGVTDFRVATFVTAAEDAYGERAVFARAHPEAWTRWGRSGGIGQTSSFFDPAARLKADPTPRAGLPHGVAGDASAAQVLTAQWGALSRAIGLDGLMLRDFFGFARAYTRYGPWGASLPDAAQAERTTAAVADLVRSLKLANPRALTMMYSSAATTTADWRANGLDLEAVARQGYLDIFVDQSWAGAWGEAGVRRQTFWNAPILGWTYQLAYLLDHAAVLATSRVRHYHLVETFDAWESWDTIHTAPDRLRWGIWAYSHAAVKTPTGVRVPAGAYISWANHGRALLAERDVAILAGDLDAAERDAAQIDEVFGPTLVYSREAARSQMLRGAGGGDPRDRIDETVGTLAKWSLPIQSVTRIEWLPAVRSDLFVFGATTGLSEADRAAVAAIAAAGRPIALLSAAGDTDPALAALAGVRFAPHDPPVQDRLLRAVRNEASGVAAIGVAAAFDAPPTAMRVTAPRESVVYTIAGSAALTWSRAGGASIVRWEPPILDDAWYLPLRTLMRGGPSSTALAAATLSRQLAAAGRLHAAIDADQPVALGAWRTRDGAISLLAGDLEEGLRDDADRGRTVAVTPPDAWRGRPWRSVWPQPDPAQREGALRLTLAPAEAR